MYARFNVSRDTARRYIGLFVNRLAYGIQFTRPLPDGSLPYYLAKDKATETPKPLDADVVRMHLNGDITINLFSTNPETQRCKWVAIDADFDGAFEALSRLKWELKQDGVEAVLEQSRRGGHLWVFAHSPLMACEARIYIYNLALRLGVPIVGGGLKQGIEVFPKQDRIESGQYGNAIRAPLGVHRKTNLRYWFYEADVNPEAQLDYLEGVKKLKEEELRTFIQGMTLPEAYRPPAPVAYHLPTLSVCVREFQILRDVKLNRRQTDPRNWVARCPSCAQAGGDRAGDNLKISKREPHKYKCWKGCRKEDIRRALGYPVCH
jgi:hypothetical protein